MIPLHSNQRFGAHGVKGEPRISLLPRPYPASRVIHTGGTVSAWATHRVAVDEVADLRRLIPSLLPPREVLRRGEPLPFAFVKHADEQTVAALAAVFQALLDWSSAPSFNDWGVLAAPRFLGRCAMASSVQRYLAEGAWGVSPHMIPHRSLHAISGTVSQALKVHGPNFGIGGGPGGEGEALLTALALLHGKRLPGVWVVFTRVDPDLPPDEAGRPPSGSFVESLALALTPPGPGPDGERSVQCILTMDVARPGGPILPLGGQTPLGSQNPSSLATLRDLLVQASTSSSACSAGCSLGASLSVEIVPFQGEPGIGFGNEPDPVLLPGPNSTPSSLSHRPRRSA